MTGAQTRVSRMIERLGETVLFDSVETVGVVTLVHPDSARRFLPDAVVVDVRPLYAITLRHDDASPDGDSTPVVVGGASLTLLSVVDRRVAGVVLYRLALAG